MNHHHKVNDVFGGRWQLTNSTEGVILLLQYIGFQVIRSLAPLWGILKFKICGFNIRPPGAETTRLVHPNEKRYKFILNDGPGSVPARVER